MTEKQFTQELRNKVLAHMSEELDILITTQNYVNTGLEECLTLVPKKDRAGYACPTVRLGRYYKRFLRGDAFDEIAAEIVHIFQEHSSALTKKFKLGSFEDKKSRIIPMLINTQRNRELLHKLPHETFMEFSVIYVVIFPEWGADDACTSTKITYEILDVWGITADEVRSAAWNNIEERQPAVIHNMNDILISLGLDGPQAMTDLGMLVVTNETKVNGAICILYPNVQKQLLETLGDDLIVIPSSIHEVIVLPFTDQNDSTIVAVNNMISEVNTDQVLECDILGQHCFIIRQNGSIEQPLVGRRI